MVVEREFDKEGRALCLCGCGGIAPLYVQTRKAKGHIAGQPAKYIKGHNNFKEPTPYETGEIVKYCECGCGQALRPAKKAEAGVVKKGEVRRFVYGHNTTRGEFEMRDGVPWKKCQQCETWKSVGQGFYPKKDSIWGNNPCIECVDKYREENKERLQETQRSYRWRKWGFTDESFFSYCENNNSACEICSAPLELEEIAIDHCHEQNIFRGILCLSCNLGLGHFKDSTVILRAAIHYIESKGVNMAENTTVGPAGANKAAFPAAKPANHNTSAKDGRSGDSGGSGADASSATLTKVGQLNPVNP